MIDFEGFYSVDAEQVEYIGTRNKTGEAPYGLYLHLRSGKELEVWYRVEAGRKEAYSRIVRQVIAERMRQSEEIQRHLRTIERCTDRMDRRQLKIWRQLKALLGVATEEETG